MQKCVSPFCQEALDRNCLDVFLDCCPSLDRTRFCEIESITCLEKPDLLVATTCGKPECLRWAIRVAGDNDRALNKGFSPTNICPGTWFGPSGCGHFLKTQHKSYAAARDWVEYSGHEIGPELGFYLLMEARPVTISIVGGYGSAFDGCWHFCSPACAEHVLFGHRDDPLIVLANKLSYSGIPAIPFPD